MNHWDSDIADVLAGRKRWTVITADCLAVLPTIPAGSVDAVVTDIPYGEVNRESGGLRNLDKGKADDVTFPLSFVVSECLRLAASTYVWCGTEQVSELRGGFVAAGLTTRLGIWEKTNPSPMNGERIWLSSIECCVFARKPLAYFTEHCASPVWRGPTEPNQIHPTQKPEWLMRRLLTASVPLEGVALDFCVGSGTTGVAAMKMGQRFIGIEISEQYAAIARRRISEAAHHLFAWSNQ